MEGKRYEYGIEAGYHLEGEVVYPSRLNESSGILQTGNQVGMLSLAVCRGEKWCGEVQLEVRSVKETYREDYRQMLEEITEHSTELLMHCNSPVYQYYINGLLLSNHSLIPQNLLMRFIRFSLLP